MNINLEGLRTYVFSTLISRIRDEKISIPHWLAPDLIPWALPQHIDHFKQWELLLQKPLFLPNSEMQLIFGLDIASRDTKKPEPGTSLYYVRSFTMKIAELSDIISTWQSKKINYPELDVWLEAIKQQSDRQKEASIRYIGMSSHVSAWCRFNQDMDRLRTGGLYAEFIDEIMVHYPKVAQNLRIFTFPRAEVKAQNGSLYGHPGAINLHEQILIALFGLSSLLNRQSGGKYISYSPSSSDKMVFQSLRTSVFARLDQLGDFPTNDMNEAVMDWMRKVTKFSVERSNILGTDTFSITEQHELAWGSQAIPGHVKLHTILVWAGSWTTQESWAQSTQFWEEDSRTVIFLKDLLSGIAASEKDVHPPHHYLISSTINKNLMPVVNLQYWPNHYDLLDDCMKFLREYFNKSKLLVAITLDQKLSFMVASDFTNSKARLMPTKPNSQEKSRKLKTATFLPHVGRLNIRYYTSPGEIKTIKKQKLSQFNPKDTDAFIQIPCFHPGKDNYNQGFAEFRRFLNMTIWKIILTIDAVLKRLTRSNFQLGNRYQFCRSVIEDVNLRWAAAGIDDIYEDARLRLHHAWMKQQDTNHQSNPLRRWKTKFNGEEVQVNARGYINIYWERPDGSRSRITLGSQTGEVGTKAGDGDFIRTIHLYVVQCFE
jgi:hypothetical protein